MVNKEHESAQLVGGGHVVDERIRKINSLPHGASLHPDRMDEILSEAQGNNTVDPVLESASIESRSRIAKELGINISE